MDSLILKKPHISEKSMYNASFGEYTFEVDKRASKEDIAKAVHEVFNVDVVRVRTITVKGKTKKSLKKRQTIKLTSWKKALVKIVKGQKIELFDVGQSQEGAK
jgi:large subunit ribosomal protein L23